MTRILHFADLHLGAELTGIAEYAGAPAIDPAEVPYEAFRLLMDRALNDGYDGAIVAGDVFDRLQNVERAVAVYQAALDRFHEAGIPVAMIAGNHDAEVSLLPRLRLSPTATLFGADQPGTVLWEDLGIAVHGQSVDEKDDLREIAAGYPEPVAGFANIGVLHTSMGGEWSRRACLPTAAGTLDTAGYDYWALGHVHERRSLSTQQPAVYPGSVYARRASENGGRGYLDLRFEDAGLTRTPVDIAPVRYEWLGVSRAPEREDGVEQQLLERFARHAEADVAVVWTLDGDHIADDLGTARELAARHPHYMVVRPAEL